MKTKFLAVTVFTLLFLISCETEPIEVSSEKSIDSKEQFYKSASSKEAYETGSLQGQRVIDFDSSSAVEETPCSSTELGAAFGAEYGAIFTDPYRASPFGFYIIWLMIDINTIYSIYDESKQSFGENGEYTHYVVNRIRSLEKFWNMPGEIQVKGQHNAVLNDKESIIFGLENGRGYIPDFIYSVPLDAWADWIIQNNLDSEVLNETPIISTDGFAWDPQGFDGLGDMIVIGDGLVELVASVGTEEKIGWTTILAHEWAHHIQFNNGYLDYWDAQFDNAPERTRAGELEADFIAAYYMTHKRGATYNWKRIQQYLINFFQIGDCGFTRSGHHGTPLQRMESSRLGHELAASAQKKGKILSQSAVHAAFEAALPGIVAVP